MPNDLPKCVLDRDTGDLFINIIIILSVTLTLCICPMLKVHKLHHNDNHKYPDTIIHTYLWKHSFICTLSNSTGIYFL